MLWRLLSFLFDYTYLISRGLACHWNCEDKKKTICFEWFSQGPMSFSRCDISWQQPTSKSILEFGTPPPSLPLPPPPSKIKLHTLCLSAGARGEGNASRRPKCTRQHRQRSLKVQTLTNWKFLPLFICLKKRNLASEFSFVKKSIKPELERLRHQFWVAISEKKRRFYKFNYEHRWRCFNEGNYWQS